MHSLWSCWCFIMLMCNHADVLPYWCVIIILVIMQSRRLWVPAKCKFSLMSNYNQPMHISYRWHLSCWFLLLLLLLLMLLLLYLDRFKSRLWNLTRAFALFLTPLFYSSAKNWRCNSATEERWLRNSTESGRKVQNWSNWFPNLFQLLYPVQNNLV